MLEQIATLASNERLQRIIEPAVRAVGFELWGLDYQSRGRRALLRLYIDGPEGVTVDDCAQVSRQVSSALDVEDPIAGEYVLEVSSPGFDRPLYTIEQWQRYVGARVKVRLRSPFEGRRSFTGVLAGLEDGDVVLVVGDEEYLLPFDGIDRANLVDGPEAAK